jgi:hypothetical protein
MAVQDYSPYGLIKRGTDYGLSKMANIYNNNRAKYSTQAGRSTSMNNFVTNAPVVPQNSFKLGQDYSLNGQDGIELGYNQMPAGVLPVLNNAPIINKPSAMPKAIIGSPKIKPTSKGSDLPPLPPLLGEKPLTVPTSAVAGVVATQPNGMYDGDGMLIQNQQMPQQSILPSEALQPSINLANGESEAMKIAKMGQKSDWEKYGSLASGVGTTLGGVAGIYGAVQNAKYMKDQANMQKAMIRGDEANKSAFAKAAGGTYQRSGV